MKKLLISIIIFYIAFINFSFVFAWNCWESADWSITDMLNDCKPDNVLDEASKVWETSVAWWAITITQSTWAWYKVEDVKKKILVITTNLLLLAWALAIWWIVYAWILFTTAYWDDGKIKKAKDSIKWSLIWFFAALASQQLVNAIINLIYWLE